MFKEFKKFALKGNVMDLAVGVVIGAAFGKIVTSLVSDIIMPIVGLLLGKVDFSNRYINLSGRKYASLAEAKAAGAATINYGLFLNNIVDFLIIAFSIFLVIRQFNRLTRKKDKREEAPTTKKCPYCCSDIAIKAVKCAHCASDVE